MRSTAAASARSALKVCCGYAECCGISPGFCCGIGRTAIVNQHIAACLCQRECQGTPNTHRTAGYNRNFSWRSNEVGHLRLLQLLDKMLACFGYFRPNDNLAIRLPFVVLVVFLMIIFCRVKTSSGSTCVTMAFGHNPAASTRQSCAQQSPAALDYVKMAERYCVPTSLPCRFNVVGS